MLEKTETLHAIEAEQAILGGLLIDNAKISDIVDILGFEDFYNSSHQIIYGCIQAMHKAEKPIDIITLAENLESNSLLEDIGGLDYLASLSESVPTAANAQRYAEIVLDKSNQRHLNQLSYETIRAVGKESVGMLAESIKKEAEQISDRANGMENKFDTINNLLLQNIDDLTILNARDDVEKIPGLSSGIKDLDEIFGGFQKKKFYIVAGRPAMGKTAFAMNFTEHIALRENKGVAFFSLEMPAKDLSLRLMASVGRLNGDKLRKANLVDNDWERISVAMGKLSSAPIFIDESEGVTVSEIRARTKRLMKKHDIGLIVIDYLQLITPENANQNKRHEIDDISRELKRLAKQLDIPVVALSQLNRELERRPDKRPIAADLKESGSLEQDANVIIFLYRDEVYNADSDQKGTAELIVAKNRDGRAGTARAAFLPELTRFENLAAYNNNR